MKIWTALFLLAPLAACSSKSNPDSDCCIVGGDPDAGVGPSCLCPTTASNASIAVDIQVTVTGSTCSVAITETANGVTTNVTSTGTVPTSEQQCASDLPIAGE